MSCGVSLPGDKEDIEDGVSRCLYKLRDAIPPPTNLEWGGSNP